MIWVVFVVMILAVVAALILPLMRKQAAPSARVDYDVVVYRNQLGEIDRDVDRGVITPDQAEAARAEVHRRMLAAEDAELEAKNHPSAGFGQRLRIAVIAAIAIAIPAGAAAMYLKIGSPNLPGQPFAHRTDQAPVAKVSPETLRMEAALRTSPSVAGYQQLVRMYEADKDYKDAARAARRVLDLGADDAASWSEYGETVVMANDGSVVPEAMQAFLKAMSIEPKSERSRFYIGLAEAQIGNLRQAVAIWRDLERESDASAPWMPMVKEHIAVYSKQGGFDPSTVQPQGPDVKAMAAGIAAMSQAMGGANAADAGR